MNYFVVIISNINNKLDVNKHIQCNHTNLQIHFYEKFRLLSISIIRRYVSLQYMSSDLYCSGLFVRLKYS